jgi:hypothetical protein
MDKLLEFKEIFNKNNLLVYCKYNGGTVLDKKNYIVKSFFKISKNKFDDNISIYHINNLIYSPEMRIKWDDTLKLLKILQGDKNCYVVRNWLKSPMMLVAEREVIDKRIEFFHEGKIYNFSTSVNDNVSNIYISILKYNSFFQKKRELLDVNLFLMFLLFMKRMIILFFIQLVKVI